jgi:hypothetical protein
MTLNFKNLNVASLDYTDIVDSLTTFLKNEPTLSDLDYDNKASAVNMLLNILATATAYNGVYAQFGYKESFLSTATLLPSIVGIASNSSVLLEVKKSAQTTRNVSALGTAIPAYSSFEATTTQGASTLFFNTEEIAAYAVGQTVTFYSGNEVAQYGDWDFNTQSITLPLTVDPETINLYVIDESNQTTTWERVDKSNPASTTTGYYYTVLNTVNGYLVTANLPESFEIPSSYTVFCRSIVSNGSEGNSATLSNATAISFLTTTDPSGGYDDISVELAKAKVQFAATSQHRCVTISDFENAITASGISGTSDINSITVANADEPSTIKIFVNDLSESNANTLIAYLSERSVAGINIIYSQ